MITRAWVLEIGHTYWFPTRISVVRARYRGLQLHRPGDGVEFLNLNLGVCWVFRAHRIRRIMALCARLWPEDGIILVGEIGIVSRSLDPFLLYLRYLECSPLCEINR